MPRKDELKYQNNHGGMGKMAEFATVQNDAPDFKATAVMEDGSIKEVKLSDYKGKYVVLFFYPLDFTFVCPTEIICMSDRMEEFELRGAQVLGVKPGIALRGLFIIDKLGKIRYITINDLPLGRNVDEVLRVLDAIQFNEKYGEVCPANWKQGEKGMKPDQKGLENYAQAHF